MLKTVLIFRVGEALASKYILVKTLLHLNHDVAETIIITQ